MVFGADVATVERDMRILLLAVWLSGIGLFVGAPPAPAPCTCASAVETNGWCEPHHVGYVASVRIPSRLLYDVLDAHGHTLDLSTFHCPSCRKAIETDGYCGEHRIGFLHGQAYFSRLTYELARGEVRDSAAIACPVCRKNAQSHGWCKRCRLGMAGRVAIKSEEAYRQVSKALDILEGANRAAVRCEGCALAMVTDTECPFCRITYKDGKPIGSRAGGSGTQPK